jgi:hypothetical protein
MAEVEEMRQLVREAHELLKDMRLERREIEQLLDGIPYKVDERIEAQLTRGLEKLGEETRLAMDRSVAKVGREFDRLQAICTGTDPKSRRAGAAPLEELLHRQRVAQEEGQG